MRGTNNVNEGEAKTKEKATTKKPKRKTPIRYRAKRVIDYFSPSILPPSLYKHHVSFRSNKLGGVRW